MDEEYGYEYDEGSDIDNWENEEVFQDHEGRDEEFDLDYDYDRDEAPDYEPARGLRPLWRNGPLGLTPF
jgi:hypothetical protein